MTSTGGLQVTSACSAAGIHTAILVESNHGMKFLFDIGVYERSFCSVRDIFISHGHSDHIVYVCAADTRLQNIEDLYFEVLGTYGFGPASDNGVLDLKHFSKKKKTWN